MSEALGLHMVGQWSWWAFPNLRVGSSFILDSSYDLYACIWLSFLVFLRDLFHAPTFILLSFMYPVMYHVHISLCSLCSYTFVMSCYTLCLCLCLCHIQVSCHLVRALYSFYAYAIYMYHARLVHAVYSLSWNHLASIISQLDPAECGLINFMD